MRTIAVFTLLLMLSAAAGAQATAPASAGQAAPYEPKFAGDRARSPAEAAALGYMRTVVVAQKLYNRKHGRYAESLSALVGSGSFTRRMVKTDRGDYKVNFHPKPKGYGLALTPQQFDAAHRAFYVDETGDFRGEDAKAANEKSPALQ